MPRKKGDEDPCWTNVSREYDLGKRHPKVTCNYCFTKWVSKDRARVLEHLNECNALPSELWNLYKTGPRQPVLDAQGQPLSKKRKMESSFTANSNISAEYHQDALDACSDWIAATGLPLSAVEHESFKVFLRKINPMYTPPSGKQIKNVLLEKRRVELDQQLGGAMENGIGFSMDAPHSDF